MPGTLPPALMNPELPRSTGMNRHSLFSSLSSSRLRPRPKRKTPVWNDSSNQGVRPRKFPSLDSRPFLKDTVFAIAKSSDRHQHESVEAQWSGRTPRPGPLFIEQYRWSRFDHTLFNYQKGAGTTP